MQQLIKSIQDLFRTLTVETWLSKIFFGGGLSSPLKSWQDFHRSSTGMKMPISLLVTFSGLLHSKLGILKYIRTYNGPLESNQTRLFRTFCKSCEGVQRPLKSSHDFFMTLTFEIRQSKTFQGLHGSSRENKDSFSMFMTFSGQLHLKLGNPRSTRLYLLFLWLFYDFYIEKTASTLFFSNLVRVI